MLKNNDKHTLILQHSYNFRRLLCLLILIGAWFFPGNADGHDWPMWRYDAGRRAATPEQLPEHLYLQWMRELTPPKPAWPESQYKLRFDTSYEPVVAGETIFVGSMVTDSVTAYDTKTGREKWRFYSDGPVRFAPVIYKDKLYFASDDGCLYCLNTKDGSLIRKFLGGPSNRKVLGNDRLVGMWPMRGGPVLYEGKIYFAAGIWPFMGIFIYAIDAETGEIVWENTGSGSTFTMQPHNSPAFAGVAPQGYMAVGGDKLLVSGGRSTPAAYDLNTGKFLYYHLSEYGKAGTSKVIVSGDYFFNLGLVHKLSDGLDVYKASASVISDDVIIGRKSDGSITAFKLAPGAKKAEELWQAKAPSELNQIHLKAGSQLYGSGPEGTILAINVPADGKPADVSWQGKVDGEVWTMIAADGRLFVTTKEGKLYCFAGERTKARHYGLPHKPIDTAKRQGKRKIGEILKMSNQKDGYCLVLGLGTGDLLYRLLSQTDLHIIALDPDADKVEAMRRELDDAGLYGTRVTVQAGDIKTMQLPPYMANLIVVERLNEAGFHKGNDFVNRVFNSLRPYGGVAWFFTQRNRRQALLTQSRNTDLPNCKIATSDLSVTLTREGALPGSADWTHQYSDSANTVMSRDKIVKAPLGLLWFGGPSNDKILPRHGHGPSPHVVGGRLFIEGRNILRAVDVYTGRLLWEREFEDLGKFYDKTEHQPGANEIGSNYVSLDDAIYVVYGDKIKVLDPATGKIIKEFTMPGDENPRWGALMAFGDLLLATASPLNVPLEKAQKKTKRSGNRKPDAEKSEKPKVGASSDSARTDNGETNKQLTLADMDEIPGVAVNADYSSGSKMLVVMDRHTGEILWKRSADYSFRHNAIVIADNKVFCIDGMSDPKLAYLKRRGIDMSKQRTLYALDARDGELLWKSDEKAFGTWLAYSTEHGILLEAGSLFRDRATDEAGKGMTAYRGSDGKVLWKNDDRYEGPPILYHDRIITQNSGGTGSAPVDAKALDLLTGRTIMRKHPMTGQTIPWTWLRFYGCNTAVASEHLLTFRSASAGFTDLDGGLGTANIGGFKSGCTSNLIVADGVLNAPDYTRTCICSYQNQASLALVHMPELAYWTFDYYAKPSKPAAVRQVGINLGAPGNHYTKNGSLWLEFPSVGGPSPDIPVRAKYDDPRWIRYHNSRVEGDQNWVAASGVTGIRELAVRMFIQPGENPSTVKSFGKSVDNIPTWKEDQIEGAFDEPRLYTVRLYFAEIADCQAGQRVFDVSLQGRQVLHDFDIAKAAGGVYRSVVKEFRGIGIKDDLRITLTPVGTSKAQPLLNGVEIIAEGW